MKDLKTYKVEITDFCYGGYTKHYFEIIFKCDGLEFSIAIPVKEHITEENFEFAHDGKCMLWIKTDCVVELIYSTWIFDELPEKLIEYLEEHKNKI